MKIATLLATACMALALVASAATVAEAQQVPGSTVSAVAVTLRGVRIHFHVPQGVTAVRVSIAGPQQILDAEIQHLFYTETGGPKKVLPIGNCVDSPRCDFQRAENTIIDDETRRGNTAVDLSTVYVGTYVPTTDAEGEDSIELPRAVLYGFAVSVNMDLADGTESSTVSQYFHRTDEGRDFALCTTAYAPDLCVGSK